MNKAIKYAANGALIFGVLNGLINAFRQLNNDDEDKSFDWMECLKAAGKGAALGGFGGLAVGSVKDDEMTDLLNIAGGTSGFLKKALDNYMDDDNMSLHTKAQEIQLLINSEFGALLSEYPSLNGSIVKGTDIYSSDIDIHVRFNKKSGRIEDMINIVETFFRERFEDKQLSKIRRQNHSIGLFFETNGKEERIDIVPMREIDNGRGDTYIYSTKSNGIRKTNAQKQIGALELTNKQKQIIKLLKGWKIDNGLRLPSILIEYIVKKAFSQKAVPRGLDKTLLFVVEFIANNITSMRIVDPANSNNVISDSLSYDEKAGIQSFCREMLADVSKDARNILDYFDVA